MTAKEPLSLRLIREIHTFCSPITIIGIQCKYRQDTDHRLTWREISTFTGLTFGVCPGFSFCVICSTTERITHE